MTITRTCSLIGATLVLALGASACGSSDEEDVRASLEEWVELGGKEDRKRACALLTPRAQGQIVGLLGSFAGGSSCLEVMGKTEPGDDDLSVGDVAKAKLTIRDDRAVFSFSGEDGRRIGMRKSDGEWLLDDLINPSLDERPRRIHSRLTRGTDEQQLRATYKALGEAFARKDYERGCALFSYAAEGQLLLGRALASFGETEQDQTMPDLSCAASMRALAKLADGDDDDLGFPVKVPSGAALAAARVSIRGARATVKVTGEEPGRFIREEGHWRVAAEESEGWATEAPSPTSLERCWRRAGASIASSAGDLRFAVGTTARNVTIGPGRVSVKGKDWRIFYTLPSDGEDPGLATVIAKPSTVSAVAYVEDAPAHAGVVTKARECGD